MAARLEIDDDVAHDADYQDRRRRHFAISGAHLLSYCLADFSRPLHQHHADINPI